MAERVVKLQGPPGHRMMGGGPKLENPGPILKRLMGYILKHFAPHCILVVVCIVISALAQVQGTLFIQKLVDVYVLPMIETGSTDFSPLAAALLHVASIYVVGLVCAYLWTRIMVSVSQGTLRGLRAALFEHMERLPIRYFDTHSHGDIMSVYTNDIDTLRQFISMSLPQLSASLITILSVFVSMLIMNVPLALISLVMVCVMLLSTRFLVRKSGSFFRAQQQDLGAVNGHIEEMMSGQKVVKVFCHEDKSLEEFRAMNDKLRVSAKYANTFSNIMMPVNIQLGNLSYVLCAVVGGMLAINGYAGLTLGTLISFMTLNKNFNQPIGQVSQQLSSAVMALAGADRIFKLLDEAEELDEGRITLVNARETASGEPEECPEHTGVWAWKQPQDDGTSAYTRLSGDVVFDHVSFGYLPDQLVLHDINLYATSGQKIAFVGSTGAGKTTITNLINRFYDIASGTITYDGININQIKKPDLRRSLGIVLQDTHLFTGTVMDNIRYGRLDATDEDCIQAARLVSAHSFISRLPDGYQTVLTGDGASLSQGQRQLIAIARAAVADPPVLILDEATSSIDTRTESLVQKGMDSLMEGRTTFVIAHRLSTVRNSDCIMVVEGGHIIERGSHDELIAQKGRYYQLYTGSSGTLEG